MESDSTLRAGELKDVFQMLNVKYLTSDERLDLLVTVKSILQVSLTDHFSHAVLKKRLASFPKCPKNQ